MHGQRTKDNGQRTTDKGQRRTDNATDVHDPENGVRLVREEPGRLGRIDAGNGDERADAVDDQRTEQEQQSAADLPETGSVAENGGGTAQCVGCHVRMTAVMCVRESGLELAAGGLDVRRLGALGRRDALERHGTINLAGQRRLWPSRRTPESAAGSLERLKIDDRTFDLGELAQHHFGAAARDLGAEADLGHPALNGHLAAFEADLMIAALTRALALGATTAGLTLAGGCAATTRAERGRLAPGAGWSVSSNMTLGALLCFRRMPAALRMPSTRFSGVPTTSARLMNLARAEAARAEAGTLRRAARAGSDESRRPSYWLLSAMMG